MSISVMSSGFIGIPYSITFRGAKQGSTAATIKLTNRARKSLWGVSDGLLPRYKLVSQKALVGLTIHQDTAFLTAHIFRRYFRHGHIVCGATAAFMLSGEPFYEFSHARIMRLESLPLQARKRATIEPAPTRCAALPCINASRWSSNQLISLIGTHERELTKCCRTGSGSGSRIRRRAAAADGRL